uniref:Amino acid transporter transmembrane domain-containing protein n=1 Tax=Sus scrofa TaxID=9823 RepID=A0A8D1BTA9_PIG
MTAAAASNWGLITNIVNSIVGVSVLTMPFCFKQCGIVLGALLLVFCSWMTHQSCMFLVKAASLSKRRTYAGLALHAYGKAGKMLVETSMIGLMLGTCVAFYVVIGDLGANFFARLFGFQVTGTFRVLLLFAVSLCVVLPLSLQRNVLASVQSFSAMALIFYTVFMFVIVLSSLKHGLFVGQWLRRVSYVRWEGVFRCIPIFGMSFACQSQVLPTYDSLDEPSVKTMSSIFASSLNVVTTFYVTQKDGTFAAGGYMPPLRFKALTLSVVFGTAVGGVLIPDVETVLGLTGATMGSLICFICPALIYKKIHKNALPSQVVLWVGLGVLVISTHSTLSVSKETPVDLAKEAPGGKLGEAEGAVQAEAVRLPGTRLPGQNPIVDVAKDGRGEPKLPDEKEEAERAQIKGPVNVPPREDAKEKQEVAQLDRPGQGVAVPLGEAHRHEPPVPHDEVVVDEGQDREGAGNERPSRRVDEMALGGKGQVAPPLLDSEQERPGQDQALEAVGGLPEDPQKVPEENAPLAVEPVKEELGPGDQAMHPGPQAVPPEGQDVLAAGAGARADGALLPGHAVGAVGKPAAQESEAGGEAPLPEEKPAPGAAPREQRNVEGQAGDPAGSKLEEAGRVEMLDHAVLLQVIKEQQVQQKRLLDQQEKLLAVIEEQHKEIHQQRQDGQDAEDADVQAEPGVAAPRGKEQEAHVAGMVERLPPQPLEAVPGAPGQPPALPQGHSQHSKEEPEGAAGRVPAAPAGGADPEPQAAQAEPREGQRGAVPEAEGAHVPERVPVPDPAQVPGSPEKHGAGDSPGQSQDVFGGGALERNKSGKEAPAAGAAAPGAGAAAGEPQAKPQPVSRDRVPAGLSNRSGGAAAGGGAGQQGGRDHVPVPGKDAAGPEPAEQRPDPELGHQPAVPGAQKLDNAKPNRDLKVQAGSDLRRRRRDVAPGTERAPAPKEGVIISLHPLPGVQVSDLRSALESQLHQAAGGALRVVQGRQIKQLPRALEEP